MKEFFRSIKLPMLFVFIALFVFFTFSLGIVSIDPMSDYYESEQTEDTYINFVDDTMFVKINSVKKNYTYKRENNVIYAKVLDEWQQVGTIDSFYFEYDFNGDTFRLVNKDSILIRNLGFIITPIAAGLTGVFLILNRNYKIDKLRRKIL